MKIELLVGMIASGKSTYTARRAREGALVVNDDSVTMMIHSGQYQLYDAKLKALYKGIEHHVIAFAVSKNLDVVIDRTNLSRDSRSRYVAIARSFDVPIICTMFPMSTPEAHGSRRARSDGRGYDEAYWIRVAREHAKSYVAPNSDEGFEYITQITETSMREEGLIT